MSLVEQVRCGFEGDPGILGQLVLKLSRRPRRVTDAGAHHLPGHANKFRGGLGRDTRSVAESVGLAPGEGAKSEFVFSKRAAVMDGEFPQGFELRPAEQLADGGIRAVVDDSSHRAVGGSVLGKDDHGVVEGAVGKAR